MKCIHCNKEGVSYDGVSEMFFCKECGSLYDAEEHEQYIRNKGKIKIKEIKTNNNSYIKIIRGGEIMKNIEVIILLNRLLDNTKYIQKKEILTTIKSYR